MKLYVSDSEHLILIKLEITGKKINFIGCFRKIWRFNLIVSEFFVQIITFLFFVLFFAATMLLGFSLSLLFSFCFVLYCLFFLSPACTGMSLWTYLYRYEPQNSFFVTQTYLSLYNSGVTLSFYSIDLHTSQYWPLGIMYLLKDVNSMLSD